MTKKTARINVLMTTELMRRLAKARAEKQDAYAQNGEDLTLAKLARIIFDEWLQERGF